MNPTPQQLSERADQLLFRLAMWDAKHPNENWLGEVRSVLDDIAWGDEPPVVLPGTPAPLNVTYERASRRAAGQRVLELLREHTDVESQLVEEISRLLEDYAAAAIK